MKRILAIAAAMILGITCLVGCGDSSTETTTAVAETTDTAETTKAASGETKTIVVALSSDENSDEATCFKVIEDYVNEKTGGAFEFKYYYNASLCAQNEESDYLKSGDIDLHANLVAQNPEKAILRQAFGNVLGVYNASEFFHEVISADTEAAALIAEECAEQNSYLLGSWDSGANLFFSSKEIKSLEDLKGTQYGADMGLAAMQAMGINCQEITVLDLYESLSRGVINASSLPVSGVASFQLWEVAPYALYLNASAPSHHIEMNLDTWNSLTEEEQQYFEEGVLKSEEKFVELLQAEESDVIANFTEVTYTSDEDTQEYIQVYYQEQYNSFKSMAESAGKLDSFKTVMQAVADAAGVTVTMD